MNKFQYGFGGMQLLMVVVIMAAISLVAVPKYNAFMTKAKLTEAFNLAGESKRKISEFYMTNSRFPKSFSEAETLNSMTISAPAVVRDMTVLARTENHEVIVKVFLKDGVVVNPTSVDQYIYIAGDRSSGSDFAIEWSCGANGIDPSLLPDSCQG